MSYLTREQSSADGHPQELYRFTLGETQWLFTSADQVVVFGTDEYQPVYITRGGFTKGSESSKSDLEIGMAASNPVAMLFDSGWLTGTLMITVYRHHHEDTEFVALWKGRVTGCKWAGSTASLTAESVFTLFQRAGLRRIYQIGCPHILYGEACGLDASIWMQTATVSAVAGNKVTVPGITALGTGYYLGGMVQNGTELRMITNHTGDILTLVDGIAGLDTGASLNLWPGCGRNINAYLNKFNNLDNYGGLPYLPQKNPFSGDAIV